jgi:large subunit ribosomal protein LX
MANENPKVYRVKGKFQMGKAMQPFTVELIAMKRGDIEEKIYSDIGSKHKVKRNKILIEEVGEIPPSEATDPVVKYMLGD